VWCWFVCLLACSFFISHLVDLTYLLGTLFFSCFRRNSYQFHLSGRQRFEIVDTGKWQETPFIHLAFIGKNIDKTVLMNQLNAIVANEGKVEDDRLIGSNVVETELESFLKMDKRFEYKSTCDDVIAFRLTGKD
jgi:hypothetical protein